jgi:AGZA family xanthine/uracil permease-like MFS transporter
VSGTRYRWAAPGDVNAFFGLMLDNIADLLLTVGLLSAAYGFPTDFALQHMVPGTAIGVLVGDLLFFWMALRLARRTGRTDVTAMPLGLDTPSTFGMVVFVLGPAFRDAQAVFPDVTEAARHAWHIGICAILISGLFKFACAFAANGIRRVLPRAGLLGSLAAIALVLISFIPLLEVLHHPVIGLVALAIILTALVARIPLPFRIPGALGALLVAGPMYLVMNGMGLLGTSAEPMLDPAAGLWPVGWLEVFRFEWVRALGDTVNYLPIVIPFALATVIGGIDCTESAAAAGDEFDTGHVIGVEAFATLVASLCGGVIQTTPYIGHPAYKAMGGRAAYTLATALFVGSAGLVGYFGYLYILIPKAAVFPILMFVGLEITAQSFQVTPKRHYPAVALACVPALATLAMLYADSILYDPAVIGAGVTAESLVNANLRVELQTLRMLANGFLVTSLIWGSAMAALIDQRLRLAAGYFGGAALLTLFGVIHSPLRGGPMFLPWSRELPAEALNLSLSYVAGYALVAVLLLLWDAWYRRSGMSAA